MSKIAFIGGGNMAQAIIQGVLAAQLFKPEDIYVSDISSERLMDLSQQYKVNVTTENAQAVEQADVVILAVKPQVLNDVLQHLAPALNKPEKLCVSIAAGITTGQIKAAIPDVPVIRVMPNTPALVGQGASVLYAEPAAREYLEPVISVFASVGKALTIDEESLMDAVTALSGSGPAYFFLLMEAMIHAGVGLGLSADVAEQLVLQTAAGAASLAQESFKSDIDVGQLRKRVTSPGGTTEAALNLFAKADLEAIVSQAITAARDRGVELSSGK